MGVEYSVNCRKEKGRKQEVGVEYSVNCRKEKGRKQEVGVDTKVKNVGRGARRKRYI